MKNIVFQFIALCFFLFASCSNITSPSSASCSDDYQLEWQSIENVEAKFKIQFPDCKLDEKTETVIFDTISVDQTFLILNLQEDQKNNLGYSMSYHELTLSSDKIEAFFRTQGALNKKGLSAELEVERKLEKLPHAREFIYNMPNDLILRQRMIYHRNMIYKWSVITTKENRFNKSVTKYLNSFELLN